MPAPKLRATAAADRTTARRRPVRLRSSPSFGDGRLYFRQLLAGRDLARADPIARQMVNFVYVIGDRETGEAVAVDPAYAPDEVIDLIEADGLRLVGALATHYHADHVGGDLFGYSIKGMTELLEHVSVPVHVQRAETTWVIRIEPASTEMPSSSTTVTTSSRSAR